jgi:hypothetical protein
MLFRSGGTDEDEFVAVEGDDETVCVSVILYDDETEAVKLTTDFDFFFFFFSFFFSIL